MAASDDDLCKHRSRAVTTPKTACPICRLHALNRSSPCSWNKERNPETGMQGCDYHISFNKEGPAFAA
ncbi:hypothetical protein KCU85_g470, partial [Aureobasidium melanogenum]